MSPLLLFLLLVIATALLVTERLRADLVAMLVLGALVLLRLVEPDAALSGFSNPATITVASMFVLSAGLQASGVISWIADALIRHGPRSGTALLIMTAIAVAAFSAFINNTAAVAVFLPLTLRACQANRISPSQVMMPLSFFAMLGGTCTLIGTSTNIIVSSIAEDHGHAPFGMFEFSYMGLIMLAMGATYILLVGRHIVPERVQPESLTEGFHLNRYLGEVEVLPDSPLIGKTPTEAALGENYDLEVLGHVRNKMMRSAFHGFGAMEAGDILLVKAPAAALLRVRDAAGIEVRHGRRPDDADLRSGDAALIEAVITPNSALEGRTLKGVDFRNQYGATALAIRRHGEDIREKIGHIRLRLGDELLVLVPRVNLERLRNRTAFVVLQEHDVPGLKTVQAITACAIVAGVVVLAAMGFYPIEVTAVVGAVGMVVTGCLPVRRVYQEVDWTVVVLLAGLIPLGLALESTGAAATAVDWMLAVAGGWGPHAVLGLFFLVALLLTGAMSNNATAALLAPIALTFANTLEVDPRPFLVALTFAASGAFYTPIGYQTNLLVYGPGGYRFADFLLVGGPLAILYWIAATLLIPWFFPFY